MILFKLIGYLSLGCVAMIICAIYGLSKSIFIWK